MSMSRSRESTELSQSQWESLKSISQEHGCQSWRVLLRRIGERELLIINPGRSTLNQPASTTRVSSPPDPTEPANPVATELRPEHAENLRAFWPPGKPEQKPKKGPLKFGALPEEDRHFTPD